MQKGKLMLYFYKNIYNNTDKKSFPMVFSGSDCKDVGLLKAILTSERQKYLNQC